jgi:tetratricopeptide (TPR) repeat protein
MIARLEFASGSMAPGSVLRKSAEALAMNDFAAAEQIALAGSAQWSFDARFFSQASLAALKRQAFADARKFALAAIARESWMISHWQLLGAALSAEGRDGDARDVYERIESLCPKDPRALEALRHLKHSPCSAAITMLVRSAPTQPRLSVCLIVKGDEPHLERCLQSLHGVHDELVVIDTGASEAAITLARSHGARVFGLASPDADAAARNEALYGVRRSTGITSCSACCHCTRGGGSRECTDYRAS